MKAIDKLIASYVSPEKPECLRFRCKKPFFFILVKGQDAVVNHLNPVFSFLILLIGWLSSRTTR